MIFTETIFISFHMNEFDIKAAGWDSNPMHVDRAGTLANRIIARIPLTPAMRALEYGAGTGLASFFLKDNLKEIVMMDNSPEMVRIMNEKINASGSYNLKAVYFNLEKNEWVDEKFDLIYTMMVLHHVIDIRSVTEKFFRILNSEGYIAIADLYPEDGSFHGNDFTGHRGFDPESLSSLLESHGFTDISFEKSYVITKKILESEEQQFDVFLMTAKKL